MQVSCNGGTWHASAKESNYPTSGYTLQNVGWTAPTVSGLYWGTTLLGGRVGVKLWSGTLSKGGSITVSNLNRYRVIAATVSNYGEPMIGLNSWSGNYFAVMNSMVTSSGEPRTIAAAFSKASTTSNYITLTNAGIRSGASSTSTQLTVTAIWGLI